MREVEDHCFSARKVCGFMRAEVSGYVSAGSRRAELVEEYQRMCRKLDEALDVSP